MSPGMIDRAELLASLKSVAWFCLHFCWAISILDLYSVLIRSIVHVFFRAWKCWEEAQSKNLTSKILLASEPCCDESVYNESVNCETMYEGEVKMVMERLGLCCQADGGKIQEPVGSREMTTLFDEIEPSLEEVKEAFDVFDANNDGYIDVNELQKVLCELGFVQVPERVCQSMISSYDEDGDGRINFSEFVKLFEKSLY